MIRDGLRIDTAPLRDLLVAPPLEFIVKQAAPDNMLFIGVRPPDPVIGVLTFREPHRILEGAVIYPNLNSFITNLQHSIVPVESAVKDILAVWSLHASDMRKLLAALHPLLLEGFTVFPHIHRILSDNLQIRAVDTRLARFMPFNDARINRFKISFTRDLSGSVSTYSFHILLEFGPHFMIELKVELVNFNEGRLSPLFFLGLRFVSMLSVFLFYPT